MRDRTSNTGSTDSNLALLAFYGAALGLMAAALFSPLFADPVARAGLLLAGMASLVTPGYLRWRAATECGATAILGTLSDFTTTLKAAQREQLRTKTALEDTADAIEAIAQRQASLGAQQDTATQLRGELRALTTTVQAWQDATVAQLLSYERVLALEALSDDQRTLVAKLLADHERRVNPLGLHLIKPETGVAFDARVHSADNPNAARATATPTVANVVAWGIQLGSTIVCPARIRLATPQPTPPHLPGEPETEASPSLEIPEPSVDIPETVAPTAENIDEEEIQA